MAEDTNFLVAQDEHGFVFADFRFAGDFERARVYAGRFGVARQKDEVHVTVAFAVNVHAVAGELVEVDLDLAASAVVGGDVGLAGGEVNAVIGADDAQQVAQRGGVGRVRLDAPGQRARAVLRIPAAGVFVGDGLPGGGLGGVEIGDFGVEIGVVGRDGGGVAG